MKDRNIEFPLQPLLDLETLGSFDIFQVDAPEGGCDRFGHLHKPVHLFAVDFDIEYIHIGKNLEKEPLPFHHRFPLQRPDITQSKYGGSVGHHGHKVPFCRILISILRIVLDGQTGFRHSG